MTTKKKPAPKKALVRDEKGRVVAGGASLNPGGRPRVPDWLRERSDDILEVLLTAAVDGVVIQRDKNGKEKRKLLEPQHQLAAADKLSDRLLGRPMQSLEVAGKGMTPGAQALVALVAIRRAEAEAKQLAANNPKTEENK